MHAFGGGRTGVGWGKQMKSCLSDCELVTLEGKKVGTKGDLFGGGQRRDLQNL